MPAQEEEDADQSYDWKEEPRQSRWYLQKIRIGDAFPTDWFDDIPRVVRALLLRPSDTIRSRAETPQERKYGNRNNPKNGDLAERIEAPKVNEYDVYNISPTALGVGVLQKEVGNAPLADAGVS